MKIKVASEAFIEKAKNLTVEELERLQSRMGGKLTRRLGDEKLNTIEAQAIQLELEDEQLQEWREKRIEINKKENNKKKDNKKEYDKKK